jgi:predicted nucleic acid-binding protein
MNVVDSSGWLEYFANGANADFFASPIEEVDRLIVPVISIYEVFKRILQQRNENAALEAATFMQKGAVIEVNVPLSLVAAKLSASLQLPMADSLIVATARVYQATLWTQDQHMRNLENVRYIMKT